MNGRPGRGAAWRLSYFTSMLCFLVLASPAPSAAQAAFSLDTALDTQRILFEAIGNQAGALPNPTGGGFTYRFDPALGVFTRLSESFGPIFSDRADTTGRGKFTFNVAYTRHTFDEIDGVNLRNGELVVPVLFGDRPGRISILDARFEGDADVIALGAIYGVTDAIDVGIALPIVRASVKARITRRGFIDCTPDLSACGDPVSTNDILAESKDESTGVGDITLRGKYNFWNWPELWGGRLGLAATLDLKLPSGDTGKPPTVERFGKVPLGTGLVRVKPLLIASGEWYGFSPHVNVGAELGEESSTVRDQLVYAVGLDYTLFRRVTLIADLLGSHVFSVKRNSISSLTTTPTKANADTITGSFGLKANPFGTVLVFLNFLIPFNDTGVRDGLTPTFGLEWSF